MTSANRIATIIKHERIKRGITQEDLARKLGWVQPKLSQIENGQRKKIDIDEIFSIATILGMDVSDFILSPYFQTEQITLYKGDALRVLLGLPENSVDCIITSPPYYGQRDYDVDGQIGLEEHPDLYIERLIEIFKQAYKILKTTGSLWIIIGDTYWSGKGRSQGVDNKSKHRRFDRPQDKTGQPPLCVPKQKLLIPHRLAIAMQNEGWIVRNDNVWFKPNPIPDPVSDRCSIAHEYIFHFVKDRKYFFDAPAVAKPSNGSKDTKPPSSVWEIKLKASAKNHTAVFPEELVEIPLRATCPDDGVLLDPFCGSGTALHFGLLGYPNRKAIGIDLSHDAIEEAKQGFQQMMLAVSHTQQFQKN